MKPKLIMLNGGAGIGKTTIADLYALKHPLTLNFAGDVLIEMISDWREDELVARTYVFDMTKAAVESYLRNGHDVIVQYLLTDATHAAAFEEIAEITNADFYEVMLEADEDTAVRRLLERGVWGEKNSPKLSEKDIPNIKKLYTRMMKATRERTNTIYVPVVQGEVQATYESFLDVLRT